MKLKYWLFCCLLPLLFSNGYGYGRCHQKNCFMASETKCDEWTHCDSKKNPKEEHCEDSAIDLWVDVHDNNWNCIAKPHPGCELYKPEDQPLHSSKTDIAYHFIKDSTFGKAESRCDELYFGTLSIESKAENDWVKEKVEEINSGCLHGMIRREGTNSCYRLSHSHADNRTGWREAKNRCEAAGSTLLKIDDKHEFDWIRAHMREDDTKNGWDGHDHFWIGLMQKGEDLPWLWLDGTAMDKDITPWNYGEPNNYPDPENCVEAAGHYYNYDKNGPSLNDYDCNDHFRYICEQEVEEISHHWKPRQFWTSGQRNKSDNNNWWWRRPSHHRIDPNNFTNWCNPDKDPKCHSRMDPNDGYDCLVLDMDLDNYAQEGWWNAAKCNSNNSFICEAPVQMQVPDDEFLHWKLCDCEKLDDGKEHGFCEKYYTCWEDDDGNCRKNTTYCPENYLFYNKSATDDPDHSCIPREEFPEDYCDSWRYNDTSCTATGIFKNKRNCGKFYACIANQDGTFLMKDFTCPEGWLYYDRTGVCIPKTKDRFGICPFDYQIPDPVPQETSTQCTRSGELIAYEDPYNPGDEDFIMCTRDDDSHQVVQVGPFYCPWGTRFHEGECVHKV